MRFEDARRHMVASQVRPADVTDPRLIDALASTPRERFAPPELRDLVYVEREIEIAPGRRLLRARDFAKLIDALDVEPRHLALDVACGAGYGAAILAQLAETVIALEPDASLAETAEARLNEQGLQNAVVITGDLETGAAGQGPFDRIVIACGVIEREPSALLALLKDGGRLAAIRRRDGVSRGGYYVRSGDDFSFVDRFDAAASVVAPDFAAAKAFVF